MQVKLLFLQWIPWLLRCTKQHQLLKSNKEKIIFRCKIARVTSFKLSSYTCCFTLVKDVAARGEDNAEDYPDAEQDEGARPEGELFQVTSRQRSRHG